MSGWLDRLLGIQGPLLYALVTVFVEDALFVGFVVPGETAARAVGPALAGAAEMRYPTFLLFNAAGGVVWGSGTVLLGYLAGNPYAAIEQTVGRDAALVVAAVAVVALVVWQIRRHRGRGRNDA